MNRKVSTKKYLIAFILTVVIFAVGILVGIMFEQVKLSHSEQTILNEKVNLRSLQLQMKYIESGLADCNTLNRILETNIDELSKKMDEVINYEKKSFFSQEEFELQLQDYFLTEIQFLLISQEIDEQCSKNNVKIVYFYDENEFDTQGKILDYLKKRFGSRLLVFSLDSTFNKEPMINTLLISYNITKFPSVVIDNDILQGHRDVEELMKVVCSKFKRMKETPEECKSI